MEKLLTEQQVEMLTGLSKRWLQKMRYQGNGIRYLKIGKAVRYRATDVEAFLHAHERSSTSEQGELKKASCK